MSTNDDAADLAFAFVEHFSSGEGASKPGEGGDGKPPVVDPASLDIVTQCLCAGYGVDYTNDADRARFSLASRGGHSLLDVFRAGKAALGVGPVPAPAKPAAAKHAPAKPPKRAPAKPAALAATAPASNAAGTNL